jgi:hypothetical protein
LAPVVICAVYVVLIASGLVGAKVAVVPVAAYVTVPGTGVAPCARVKVVVVIVAGSIALLNVAVTLRLTDTLMSLLAGLVEVTVGGPDGDIGPPSGPTPVGDPLKSTTFAPQATSDDTSVTSSP